MAPRGAALVPPRARLLAVVRALLPVAAGAGGAAAAERELAEEVVAICREQEQGGCRGDLLQVKASVEGRRDQDHVYFRQTLANDQDLLYSGSVTLGNQVIPAVLDTGSYEVLAFSTSCAGCGGAAEVGYDSEASSTFLRGNLDTDMCYGSGCADAIDATETLSTGPLTVERQDFWLATGAQMPVLLDASFGAIVGMGPPGYTNYVAQMELQAAQPGSESEKQAIITLNKHTSVLESLNLRYFSACLEWMSGGAGYIVWNDAAPEEQLVSLQSQPVAGTMTWAVAMTATLSEGGVSVDLGAGGAILDTGTSLIAVPSSVYRTVIESLSHMNADCTNFQEMPDILIEIGGKTYTMPPSSYIGVVTDVVPVHVQPWFKGETEWTTVKYCQLLLMDIGEYTTAYGAMWILGMPWFRYYYTLFDLGPNPALPNDRKVWMAPASDDCHPTDTSVHAAKLQNARAAPSLWTVNASRLRGPPGWLSTLRKTRAGGGEATFVHI